MNRSVSRTTHLRSVMLEVYQWCRAQPWLRPLHAALPASWRRGMSQVPARLLAARLRFPPLPDWSLQPSLAMAPRDGPASRVGANVFGFLRGQFGIAESARMYASAMIAAGIPLTLHDVELDVPHALGDRHFETRLGQGAVHAIDIVFVNPDCFEEAVTALGAKTGSRYRIGCWFWELEHVPEAWLPAIEQVDEIMVASEFVERAFRKVTSKPILRVPLPLASPEDSGLSRADFGIEDGTFFFLASFDFHSSVHRKNIGDVITAFTQAFGPDRDDVGLLIKTSNGFRYADAMMALLDHSRSDPRIVVRDDVLDRAHLHALQRCCDAYVSLHRAEGFGLGMAECMALGKPVIATGWSGNLEFMDRDNSWLVDYRLVPVPPGAYPHGDGQHWAQPDIAQAASHMRSVVDDRIPTQDKTRRARADIARKLAPEAAGAVIAARLEAISLNS